MRALDRFHQIWYEAYLTTYYPSYQRAVRAAARDARWVCWRYAPDEWGRLDETTWQHGLHRVALTLLWGLVVIGAVSTGSVAAMPGAPANLLALAFVLLATGCSIAVVLYVARHMYEYSRATHQARVQGPPEICIGPRAVFLPGETVPLAGAIIQPPPTPWNPWAGGLDALQDVGIDGEDPMRVCFQGKRVGGRGSSNHMHVVEVPVPAGHEREAAQLVVRFHREILSDS